jgi:hypothetical protein
VNNTARRVRFEIPAEQMFDHRSGLRAVRQLLRDLSVAATTNAVFQFTRIRHTSVANSECWRSTFACRQSAV